MTHANTPGMSHPPPSIDRIEDMPLWRLLVLLDDLEREVGPSSSTTRQVARLVQERLKTGRAVSAPAAEVAHASR